MISSMEYIGIYLHNVIVRHLSWVTHLAHRTAAKISTGVWETLEFNYIQTTTCEDIWIVE